MTGRELIALIKSKMNLDEEIYLVNHDPDGYGIVSTLENIDDLRKVRVDDDGVMRNDPDYTNDVWVIW